jgi:hypothetical protein
MDGGAAGGEVVELGEFLLSAGEADFESFGFAVPAFAFGLGDAGEQVAPDAFQPVALGGVNPQEGAPEDPLTEPTEEASGLRLRSTDSDVAASPGPF